MNRTKTSRQQVALLMAFCGIFLTGSIPAAEVFRADYDSPASGGTGNLNVTDHTGALAIRQSQFFAGRCSLASSPELVSGRQGTEVIRFETRQEDGNYAATSGNRSEFAFATQASGSGNNTSPKEIWYAWSAYLPIPTTTGTQYDGGDRPSANAGNGGGREIYMQIHANDGIDLQGSTENPPVALIRVQDATNPNRGKWRLTWRWGYNKTSPLENASTDMPLELGRWTDFVLRVIWSDTAGQGIVQFWKNGRQMVNQTGIRVGYTGMAHTYFKQGVYAFDWNSTATTDTYRAVAYYDEVKVYEAATNYVNMRPRRDGSPFLEYALNGNVQDNPNLLPAFSLSANQRPTLSFLRAHGDVTYIVQSSADLSNWTNLVTNPGTVSLTVPVVVQESDPAKHFLRLKVTSP